MQTTVGRKILCILVMASSAFFALGGPTWAPSPATSSPDTIISDQWTINDIQTFSNENHTITEYDKKGHKKMKEMRRLK